MRDELSSEQLDYDDNAEPDFNTAKALFSIAYAIDRLASAVERIGLNGATEGFGATDRRGCLEKLASDLQEAVNALAMAIAER